MPEAVCVWWWRFWLREGGEHMSKKHFGLKNKTKQNEMKTKQNKPHIFKESYSQ